MLERIVIAVLVPVLERLIKALGGAIVEAWRDWQQAQAMKRGKSLAAEERKGAESGDPAKMIEGNKAGEKFWDDHVQ